MKSIFAVFMLLLSTPANARLSDGTVTLQVKQKTLVATVADGFHFNKDAPTQIKFANQEKAPIKKEEKEIVFKIPQGPGNIEVGLYVCDDKKTVCEEHQFFYSFKNGKWEQADPKRGAVAESNQPSQKNAAKNLQYNEQGFIVDEMPLAFAKAKKEKKRLLVYYGAPWCPACVRLKTEVFGTSLFQEATAKVIKVALNADVMANKEWGSKYSIKALPTILLLNEKGEELYRVLDFKPAAELASELTAELKRAVVARSQLEKKAQAGDVTMMKRLADQYFAQTDFANATKWYERAGEKSALAAYAEMSAARELDLKNLEVKNSYIRILQKWIAHEPHSYTAISARNDWAALFKDEKKLPPELIAELKKNTELLQKLVEDFDGIRVLFANWNVGTFQPYEREELFAQWLQSLELLGEDKQAKQVKTRLQDLLKAKNLSVQRPGEILTGLPYFRKASLLAEEEQWLRSLVETYPETYVYHMKMASFYKRQKSFAKALPEVQRAIELGPDFRFYNLHLLAEIQKELNQKEEAKKTIEIALAMQEAKSDKYQKTTKALEELKESL